jgi:hypothetical protein
MRAPRSTGLVLRMFASGLGLAVVLGGGQALGVCTIGTLSPPSALQYESPGPRTGSASPVSFTLSVGGSGFPGDAVVNWGGAARTMKFISNQLLRADILYSDVSVAGVVNIQVTGTGCASGMVPFAVSRLGDFNADGNADILWFHPPSGTTLIWLMSGAAYSSSVIVPSPGGTFQPVAVSNVSRDGQAHIFWRDSGGNNLIQLMKGTSPTGQTYALPPVPTNWVVGGMADFNGDGYPDIVWRDQASGTNLVWLMKGPVVLDTVLLPSAGSTWHIAGVFTHQGIIPVILWRENGGTNLIWGFWYDFAYVSAPLPFADPSWQVAALTDFDGNGEPDILWRHTSGANLLWLMDPGFGYSSSLSFPFVPPPWQVGGPR